MRMDATDTLGYSPIGVTCKVSFELLLRKKIVTVSDAGQHTPRRALSTWPSKHRTDTELETVAFGQLVGLG